MLTMPRCGTMTPLATVEPEVKMTYAQWSGPTATGGGPGRSCPEVCTSTTRHPVGAAQSWATSGAETTSEAPAVPIM